MKKSNLLKVLSVAVVATTLATVDVNFTNSEYSNFAYAADENLKIVAVPVSLLNFSNPEKLSMGNSALGKATVEKVGEGYKYSIYVKDITFSGLSDGISKFWVEGKEVSLKESNVISGKNPKVAEFILPELKEKINVEVFVQTMEDIMPGAGRQKAILKLDLKNVKWNDEQNSLVNEKDSSIKVGTYTTLSSGISLRIDKVELIEDSGFNTFNVYYTQQNNTSKKLSEVQFALFLKNGEKRNQYGFFNDLYPTESKSRVFSTKLLKTEVPSLLEAETDFFATKPTGLPYLSLIGNETRQNSGIITLKNGWLKENSSWYFYKNGVQLKNVWQGNYWLNSDGRMATNEWIYDKNAKAWYYVKENGTQLKNAWQGNYWLNSDGRMATNEWIYDKNAKAWYYVKENGTQLKNAWRGNYWLNSDGRMATNAWVDNNRYYVGANGAWVKDAQNKNGWQKENNIWYFYKNGVQVKDTWQGNYYLKSDGRMATNEWVYDKNAKAWYYVKENGTQLKNAWRGNYWLSSDGRMATNAWVDNNRYYVGVNGAWVKDKTH